MKVAMCCGLSLVDGQTVKYQGEENRQFRESLYLLAECFRRETGSELYFVELKDCLCDGSFSKHYVIKEKKDNMLVFERVGDSSFLPELIVNRRTDKTYQAQNTFGLRWNIYNKYDVAQLGNKAKSWKMFGELMPRGFIVESGCAKKGIKRLIGENKSSQWVVKPCRLNGGRGVRVMSTEEVCNLEAAEPFVVQEFCETSGGINGIVNGRHDLRVYIIDGKQLLFSVRTPASGGFLANTKAGGSIQFFGIDTLPKEADSLAKKIASRVSVMAEHYFISVDMFLTSSGWKLIEINDQPGIPASYQTPLSKGLIETLVKSLRGAYNEN